MENYGPSLMEALFENRRPWQETAELVIAFASGAILSYCFVVYGL